MVSNEVVVWNGWQKPKENSWMAQEKCILKEESMLSYLWSLAEVECRQSEAEVLSKAHRSEGGGINYSVEC